MERSRPTASRSTERKPSSSPTVTGKKVTRIIRMTLGSISYPNQSTSSGAIATVGMVWDKIKMG